MNCPNCGHEMLRGHLYCEKCGMEIRIVPDYEPEIENSITETLSTVAEEIGRGGKQRKEKRPVKKEAKDRKAAGEESILPEGQKGLLAVRLITFVVMAAAVAVVTILLYSSRSQAYQIEKAREAAQQGDYQEAVRYLDKAIALEPDNAETVLLQANYYYLLGEKQKATDLLLALISEKSSKEEPWDMTKAYEGVISIYDEQEKYEEISELLLDCPDEAIVASFQGYLALEPEFSYAQGSYDEVIPLKLSANTTGSIYYTLDGSIPTKFSKVYTAPIFLESGKYQVSALFINDYGIESEVVRNWYEIALTVPQPPQVLLYSGTYDVPTMVEVVGEETEIVYYTTDGTEPNQNSSKYTGPIELPLGRSNFKFAVISEEGVKSETVSRSYEFKLDTDITVDIAAANVTRALMERDVLTDLQGHAQGVNGKYIFQYNSIVELYGSYYYVFNEYYEDTNGSRTKAERMYAVEVYTGKPNRLIYDENGQMGLISLTDS